MPAGADRLEVARPRARARAADRLDLSRYMESDDAIARDLDFTPAKRPMRRMEKTLQLHQQEAIT